MVLTVDTRLSFIHATVRFASIRVVVFRFVLFHVVTSGFVLYCSAPLVFETIGLVLCRLVLCRFVLCRFVL